MVLASASSTVAGRTCRDHGGLVQPRKRRPHGPNGSRTSSVRFALKTPSNFDRTLSRITSARLQLDPTDLYAPDEVHGRRDYYLV